MTPLGTFWEGFVLIAAAIAAAVLGSRLAIPYLGTVAPVLLTAGLAYVSGGAAGKVQALRGVRKFYSLSANSIAKIKETI